MTGRGRWDAPSVCLILSCVSGLNGSNCYQHHHQLSFLSEGDRHMHSRHLAHSESQKASSQAAMDEGTLKHIFNHRICQWKCLWWLQSLFVRRPFHSVVHKHWCGLTDVIKRRLSDSMILLPLNRTGRQRSPHPQISTHLSPTARTGMTSS